MSRELDQVTSRRPFQTQPLCDSVISSHKGRRRIYIELASTGVTPILVWVRATQGHGNISEYKEVLQVYCSFIVAVSRTCLGFIVYCCSFPVLPDL